MFLSSRVYNSNFLYTFAKRIREMKENNKIGFKAKLNDKQEKELVAFLNNREGDIIYIGSSRKIIDLMKEKNITT